MTTLHMATGWVAEDPSTRARANRDGLRQMMFGVQQDLTKQQEDLVTAAQAQTITALLTSGVDVVADDMNLQADYLKAQAAVAAAAGAAFEIHTFDVPVDEAVRRDATRPDGARVGEQTIRHLATRFTTRGKVRPVVVPMTKSRTAMPELVRYVASAGLPKALICDIDGTIALRSERDPHDLSCVEQDTVNRPVLDALLRLAEGGTKIIFLTGRSRVCEDATYRWLRRNIPAYFPWELYMRAASDDWPDQFMKSDLFDRYVRGRFDVKWVLDDRDKVVHLWRGLGLTCFQVADGAF